jgi:tetratricopeptide (TPR) repeat protein/uncharacterized caspase-like protein
MTAPLTLLLAALLAQQPTPQQRDLKFEKDKPDTPAVAIPRSYALVIGISHYRNLPPEGQLDFPQRDAEAIYTTLISTEGGQFPPENVHKLLGPQATLANIRKELETWLPSVTRDDDRVLVYFAGHGFVSGGKAYLAPYDIDRANIPGTSYPMESLGAAIGTRIKGKWKVLLTDACHSGAITPEADRAQVNQSLLDLNKSLFSLTASRDREQSFESARWGGGHGIFTYYAIKGLEGEADTSGDGVVSADELAEYVHNNVREATQQRQNPTSERGSFDPNMVLAYNPGRAKAALKPEQKFGAFVIETNMDATEVFVDDKTQGTVNKGTPLRLPGLAPGAHTVQGVHMGYEPDGPRQESVYPGQDTLITIRISIPRRKNRAAVSLFDKGLSAYNDGGKQNYEKAAALFQQALDQDPTYSQAALYLGRTYNALFDQEKAAQLYRKAIEIDPDYTEARASYGGMLLDRGDYDEAIRQLNAAVQKEPANALAWYLMSVAFSRKEAYPEAVRAARESIRLAPTKAETHFWLAEALRLTQAWKDAEPEYRQYLQLSNFDSGVAGKVNYYVAGYLFGLGKKRRAAQADIWKEMHSEANFGLCECEAHQKRYDEAIGDCQKAIAFDPTDPFAHYRLALTFSEKYNASGGLGLLAAARKHFDTVLELNPDTPEAGKARKYIQNIDTVLAAAK